MDFSLPTYSQISTSFFDILLFFKKTPIKNYMFAHEAAIPLILAVGLSLYLMAKARKSHVFRSRLLDVLRIILFSICLYSLTPWAENQNMAKHTHTYSNWKMFYFTNQSALLSLVTVAFGFIYRYRSKCFKIYNTILPTAIAFETFLVTAFWYLYFKYPTALINKKATLPGFETPLLTELGLHLFPLVLLLIDQIDFRIEKTKMQTRYLIGHLSCWVSIATTLRIVKGKFMYPFLNLIKNVYLLGVTFVLFFIVILVIQKTYISLKKKSNGPLCPDTSYVDGEVLYHRV